MKKFNLNELKIKYIDAAIIHGKTTMIGDYKLGNKQVLIMHNIYKLLKSSEEGRDILRSIMFENDPSVRTWAARDCLPYFPKEAERVLNEIQKLDNIFGFNAKITLNEWKKGNLRNE
jgi:hypothetical protein